MPATALRVPATLRTLNLEAMPVLVSAAMPDAMKGSPQAYKLQDFFVAFVQALLHAGGRLVFGGHPTITPLVHRVARELSGPPRIELYQSIKHRGREPEEAHDSQVFNLHWIDDGAMREEMTRVARAAVFLGGRTRAEHGDGTKPGIRDEYERFLRQHPRGPAYLLGFLGGEAKLMIEEGFDDPSSLTQAEKKLLHSDQEPDLVTSLILADLRRQLRASTAASSSESRTIVVPLAAKRH